MGFPTDYVLDFMKTLQGDDSSGGQSVVVLYDSLLAQLANLKSVVPVAAQVALNRTGIQDAMRRERALGEIDRQLFLQFLQSEISFIRARPRLTVDDLYHRVHHDQDISRRKQVQIRSALMQLFVSQGVDQIFYSALSAQQAQVGMAALVNAFGRPPHKPAPRTLDEFLQQHEVTAGSKVIESLIVTYGQTDDTKSFDARSGWHDLKQRWDGWASKYRGRLASFKKYWKDTGGGHDLNSNSQAVTVMEAFYNKMYEEIESGDLARFLAQALKSDPWS